MGCDVHMYVEYRRKDSEIKKWSSFGKRINPGRNYLMFGIMCEGVRTAHEFSFPERGIPEDVGYAASNDNEMFISESGGDEYVNLETAQEWVKDGSSRFILDKEGNPQGVTHPDWHSHSWLSTKEFSEALAFYNNQEAKWSEPEYEAILSAMKRFEELGFESRIVFWFDN